jgi:RNA recognition motif-containing protein
LSVGKRLYVGNLPFSCTDDVLRSTFERHGQVLSASVIMDRETGRSRGFGFVEMEDGAAAAAIQALDGSELDGRSLRVNEAHERERRPGGGGGGGGFRDRRPR